MTGANAGIGFETARALAHRGFRVAMVCRSAEKGEAARRQILEEVGHSDVTLWIADLGNHRIVTIPLEAEGK